MSEDRRVKGRSDEEVRRHAKNAKLDYRVDRIRPVNVLRVLRSGSVQTLYGRKKLFFKIVDDELLGSSDAKTESSKESVTITCKRSVERDAELGVGRPRMTLAHELGHAVMHSGEPNFRHAGAQGKTALSEATPYVSAEHQAKVFASAFLIHDEDAAGMAAEEIAIEFGVSLEAAKICFDRLLEKAERARSVERVLKMNEEVKAVLLGKKTYLEDICTVCHQPTLLLEGNGQVSCDTCGFRGNRYQDGDRAA
jgi:IrrE N-terminal-like domain